MRTMWNVVSFMAVVHLLALVVFIGWLWHSQRLDGERFDKVRELFALTVPEAQLAVDEALAEEVRLIEEHSEELRRGDPPLASADQVKELDVRRRHSQYLAQRLIDEQRQLVADVEQREQALMAEREKFETERDAWLASRGENEQLTGDEQFARAVKILSSLPPKLAKQRLEELVRNGNKNQAIAYLNAMNTRIASKILREFKSDQDNRLATELLEGLRTLGTVVEPDVDSADANNATDNSSNS